MNGKYYSNESAKASAAVSSEGNGASFPKPKPKAITKVKAVKEPSTTKKSKTKNNVVLEEKDDVIEVVWTGKGSDNSTAHSAVPSSTTTPTSSDSSLPKAANKKLTTGWIEYCNAERERVVKEAGIGVKVKKPTVGTLTLCVSITSIHTFIV